MILQLLGRHFLQTMQPKFLLELVELIAAQRLEIHETISSALGRANELVELQVNGARVTVLRVLNHEHHQERDDGGAGIDHELPRIAEVKQRSGERPYRDDREREHE